MAFAIVARHVPTLDWFNPGLSPRMDQASYHILDARQNSTISNTTTTANATVNMFIDSEDSSYEYAASIVTACVDQTVYALQCTAAPEFDPVGSNTCGPNAVIVTVTSGASLYSVSSAITTQNPSLGAVTGTAVESCSLAGTTAANCAATLLATGDGSTISTATTETLSGSNYYRFNVEITGGAEKTASATATCAVPNAKGNAAASLNVKNVVMWVLAGVTGVASIQMML